MVQNTQLPGVYITQKQISENIDRMQRDVQGTYKNKITDAWRKDDARA